jgi:apolipoprotein D and lipocalin family protein
MIGRLLIAGTLSALAGCCDLSALFPPLDVVSFVDPQQYVGKWYEVARYPTFFQANCVGSTAEYTLRDDGTIGVLNTCLAADGSTVSTIEGYAEITDPTTNAKLLVHFPSVPVPGTYWIIDLDPNYQYAVVGEPTRSTLFILSRTPTLEQATLDAILARLPDAGYDPARLVYDTYVPVQ